MRTTYIGEREELIERIGVRATDVIQDLRNEIDALYEYLGVIKIYSTKGYRLVKQNEQTKLP